MNLGQLLGIYFTPDDLWGRQPMASPMVGNPPYMASYDWKTAWQQERRQVFRLTRQIAETKRDLYAALRRVDELEMELAMAQADALAEA